jgi:hypothetical protein
MKNRRGYKEGRDRRGGDRVKVALAFLYVCARVERSDFPEAGGLWEAASATAVLKGHDGLVAANSVDLCFRGKQCAGDRRQAPGKPVKRCVCVVSVCA